MIARRTRWRVRIGALACAASAGLVGSIVYGCSLGLDPSKIGAASDDSGSAPVPDASPDTWVADVAVTDAPDGDASDADAGTPGCLHDTDCVSSNTCRIGSCDAGTCSFAVCPATACMGSSCSAGTETCTAAAPYGFHAMQLTIEKGNVGCDGNAPACLAAAYPFVFVGTTNGVVAYTVSDPSNPALPAVSVLGVPFLPSIITAMGSRVYFFGSPEGSGPEYRLAIASLDVPDDPLATALTATTVYDAVSISSLDGAWATTDGSLFLVEDDGTGTFPSAYVAPPLTDGATITFYPSPGITPGGSPVVPSGSRMVIARPETETTPYQTYFSFETAAGTPEAADGTEQPTFGIVGPTFPQSVYAQGNDGSVLWNTETVFFDDAGNTDVGAVRFAWLVANGSATSFAPNDFVNAEQYSPPILYDGNPLAGPVAWVDPVTALVLAAAPSTNPGTTQGTSVQVAVMTPSPALASGKRSVVGQTPDQVAAVASGGFGYVLAAGATGAATCTLHIFAPSCATSP